MKIKPLSGDEAEHKRKHKKEKSKTKTKDKTPRKIIPISSGDDEDDENDENENDNEIEESEEREEDELGKGKGKTRGFGEREEREGKEEDEPLEMENEKAKKPKISSKSRKIIPTSSGDDEDNEKSEEDKVLKGKGKAKEIEESEESEEDKALKKGKGKAKEIEESEESGEDKPIEKRKRKAKEIEEGERMEENEKNKRLKRGKRKVSYHTTHQTEFSSPVRHGPSHHRSFPEGSDDDGQVSGGLSRPRARVSLVAGSPVRGHTRTAPPAAISRFDPVVLELQRQAREAKQLARHATDFAYNLEGRVVSLVRRLHALEGTQNYNTELINELQGVVSHLRARVGSVAGATMDDSAVNGIQRQVKEAEKLGHEAEDMVFNLRERVNRLEQEFHTLEETEGKHTKLIYKLQDTISSLISQHN